MSSVTLRGVTIDEVADDFVLASLSLPGITARQSVTKLLTGGSTFTGPDLGESGAVELEAHILGANPADCTALISQLSAAWAPSIDDVELLVSLPGSNRIYKGRPASCLPAIDGTDTAAARCSFTLTDWRWYGAESQSITVAFGGTSGGFVTPFVTPFVTTGTGPSGDASVTNNGTAPVEWTATIFGPVTSPRLILGGKTVFINATIGAGSVVTVSSEDTSVIADGGSRPWAAFTSDWWTIPPGTSTFSARAIAGTGTVTLSWRDGSY